MFDNDFIKPKESRLYMINKIKLWLEIKKIKYDFNFSPKASYTFIFDKDNKRYHVAVELAYQNISRFDNDYNFYIGISRCFDEFYKVTNRPKVLAIDTSGKHKFEQETGKKIITCDVKTFLMNIGINTETDMNNYQKQYFNYNQEIINQSMIKELWKKSPLSEKIFIAYKNEDKKVVMNLKHQLESKTKYAFFMATENIENGKRWRNELEIALFSADLLLLCISDENESSSWIDQEVGIAYGRKIPIVLLSSEKSKIQGFIEQFQAEKVNFNNIPLEQIIKLINQKLYIC